MNGSLREVASDPLMGKMHEANRKGWDAAALVGKGQLSPVNWRCCLRDPGLVFSRQEMKWLAHVSGKDICVLGSGDNLAVFALAGLGARVTSVDISREQLNIAGKRGRSSGYPSHLSGRTWSICMR